MERDLRWPLSGRLVWRKGCNHSFFQDFASWAKGTGCGKAPQPAGGPSKLTLHMAWAGKWNDVFAPDISATLDSFIITQPLASTRLMFWFLEPLPRGSRTFDALKRRAERLAPGGAIEFREVDVAELGRGTCVADVPELWATRGPIPMQTKSDVFRLLVLNKHGGIWIDTDTILLRDVTPVWEWGGEWGGKFAMTLKYNNAFLGLRKNSSLSRALLGLACKHPQSKGRWPAYCAEVGSPCHTEWYYNHGPQQWAVRNDLGLVPFPIGLFDPANDCWGRGMLSGSGAYRMRPQWPLSTLLELFRGAFSLHTRSYQVAKKDRPLGNNTQFGALFSAIRRMANRGDRGRPIAPGGVRNATELAWFNDVQRRNRHYTPPDPTFTPPGPASRCYLLQRTRGVGDVALTMTGLTSNGYAKTFRVAPRKDATAEFGVVTSMWLVFNTTGHWMPASSNVVQTYCVDADEQKPVKGRPDNIPDLVHCDPRRPGQRWEFRRDGSAGGGAVRIVLASTGKCLGIAPVADARFCGAGTMRVEAWQGKALPESQCLNAAVVDCEDETASWDMAPVSRGAGGANVLRTDALPPLVYDNVG